MIIIYTVLLYCPLVISDEFPFKIYAGIQKAENFQNKPQEESSIENYQVDRVDDKEDVSYLKSDKLSNQKLDVSLADDSKESGIVNYCKFVHCNNSCLL